MLNRFFTSVIKLEMKLQPPERVIHPTLDFLEERLKRIDFPTRITYSLKVSPFINQNERI